MNQSNASRVYVPARIMESRDPERKSPLFDQETIYRRLVQTITDYALYMIDVDGIVCTWNAGARLAKGYEPDEIIGCHYSRFYSVEDRLAGIPNSNLNVARKFGKYEAHGWRLRKDGSRFWAHVVIDALKDERGQVFGFAKITRDCTLQRLVEVNAQESEQRFRYLVQGVTDYAIYMLDVNGIVANWNLGAQRAKGYAAHEIVGEHFSRFYIPEERAAGLPQQALEQALREGKFETEGWRVRKDQTRFWAHVIIDPIYNDEGELFGFAKVTRDRTEALILQRETRDQERRFQLLVEGVSDYAIYMLDTDGHVTNWNSGAQRAKGYTASEIVGTHFSVFYELADREAGVPEQGLQTARKDGRFEAHGWRLRKDGNRFWAHVTIQPVYDEAGQLFGFAKVTRDCTAERESAMVLESTSQNLDLALDNMLQGLCLFDRNKRLLLCNTQFKDLFSLSSEDVVPGCSIRNLLRKIYCNDTHTAVPAKGSLFAALRKAQEAGDGAATLSFDFAVAARCFNVSTRQLSHGGWVSTVEDVTERREAATRIEYLAHHDHLTGLPNRARFQETLSELVASGKQKTAFALHCLDLDGFKRVNDSFGHLAGDRLLKAVTERLTSTLRGGDFLARLSGDEFAIVQTGCEHKEQASTLAKRCIDRLSDSFDIYGEEVVIGVSVGIVFPVPASESASQLLRHGDLALYSAKHSGKGRFCFHEESIRDALDTRLEMEQELTHALRNDEFHLHYQPIVDAASGRWNACEALLRWEHPVKGNIPPATFIGLAEQCGQMPAIGAWVLREACREAAGWPPAVRLSVNVSPAQLLNDDFRQLLLAVLKETSFEPQRLELEITETALLAATTETRGRLQALRELGVGIAMDDFGIGYSSLSLLKTFPFTRIKVDRSFVQDVDTDTRSRAIVRCIAALCESLNAQMVAEGVETQGQKDILLDERCHEMQGFLIARPMPAAKLQGMLRQRQAEGA